jgi:hypothetical protein
MERKSWFAICVGAVALTFPASGQATTIGQLAPGNPPPVICGFGKEDTVQTTITSGTSYTVPPFGAKIVQWSTNAGAFIGGPQVYTFKVFRPAGPSRFTVVGHDGPHLLTDGTLNSFPVDIAVKPGDIIGLYWDAGSFSTACEFIATSADDYLERSGGLADGESGDFSSHGGDYRLNVSAEVKPSSSFSLGKVKDNPNRGTATVAAEVPGPGELTVSGKGVKASSAGAVESVRASGPGMVKVPIRPKGKVKRRLRATGKAKVQPTITYTPSDGDANSQRKKVKLSLR